MATTRVAERYAKALMDLAQQDGKFDATVEDIRMISRAMAGSRDLQLLLHSPVIDDRKKEAILRQIFGGKIGTLVDRFISLLVLKGRGVDLPAIITAFERLVDKATNMMPATITTAVELGPAQREKLEQRIATISGHTVRANYLVDPSLIGGFLARFEDQMIDASVRHQLDRLRESFVEGNLNLN
jgi:F-type H+-transporting ATPase subunit delta